MTNDFREKLFKSTIILIASAFASTAKNMFDAELWTVFQGLSINIASQFSVEACMPYITKKWLSHPEKIVNHHIQRVLHLSIKTALSDIEEEYLDWDGVSPKEIMSLQSYFAILRTRSEQELTEETHDELKNVEILDLIYHQSKAILYLTDILKINLDPNSDEYYFTNRFISYFPARLAERTQFHFREQLKKGKEAKQALDLFFFIL